MKRCILAAALAATAATSASRAPAEPAYRDDRSTPEAVIASLYNAVTLQDMPRAWSYFHPSARPPFKAFATGYADTESVAVRTGEAMAEGAAGTTWWRLPTVIEAHRTDGSVAVFSGCYVLSQSNPHLRDTPPYDPIGIREGHLSPVSGPFDAVAPGPCD